MGVGVFANQFVADIVGADKLSWRAISDWLIGIGAIPRDAVVPGALASGLAYAHVLNVVEPGLVRLGEKERASPFLVYASLRQGMHRLNVHACGQNIADCIHWSLAPEWTSKDHLHFCALLHALSSTRMLGDAGSDDEEYVRLQDLIEPDERNRLLRRRVDQLQLAHRALTEQCDSLHAELGTERETVAHLHAILERTAIDSSSQLLPYSDLVFAFATADVERAGKLRADALADALRAIGIARVPDAALASLRDAPGARGEREIDFASFARAASIAYVEHVRQLSAREEAIAAIRAAFDRRDPSRTGLVDAAECESMLRDAGLSAGAEAVRSALHAQRAGRDLDLFALVRLYDELVARGHAARSPAEMTADERARRAALRKAFNKYDSDRSGSITKLELAQAFRAAGMSYDAKTVADVFDKADKDGSGTIDFAEFLHLADVLSGRTSAAPAPPARDSAQTAALRQAFAKYDKDNSGSITKLELAQAFRASGMSYDAKTVADVFDKADKDGSGTIDFAEFLHLADVLSGRTSAAPAPPARDSAQTAALRQAFAKYDKDNSGSITKLELAQAFRAAGMSYDAKTVADVFDKADKDGSGTIDFAEFLHLADVLSGRTSAAPAPPARDSAQTAALRQAFAKYDKDNSGSITKLELAQAFRAAGMSYDAKTVADVFDKADKDGSGTIDFAEFLHLADVLSGRTSAAPAPPARDSAQTAALRQAFAKYDKDNSGSITKLELAQAFRAAGMSYDAKTVADVFDKADKDGSGTIDFAEFLHLADMLSGRTPAAPAPPARDSAQTAALRQAFAKYDKDNSGSITKLELAQAFRAAGMSYDAKTVADVFDKADKDGSGTIDFAEFLHLADVLSGRTSAAPAPPARDSAQTAALRQAFAKYDKDNSGSITKLELAQAFRAAGMSYDAKTVADVFDKADKDGSGTIDFAEFLHLADMLSGRTPAAPAPPARDSAQTAALRQAFAKYDKDNSGSITKLELAQAFRAAGMSYDAKTVADVFDKADKDGSGTIDFAEFLHLADVLANRAPQAAPPSSTKPVAPSALSSSFAPRPSGLAAKPMLSVPSMPSPRSSAGGLAPASPTRIATAAAAKPPAPPPDDARTAALRTAFRRYDADNSGSITKLELASAFRAAGMQFDAKVISDTFDKADRNKDGNIGFEEFVGLADMLAKGR